MRSYNFVLLFHLLVAVTGVTQPPVIVKQGEQNIYYKAGETVQLPCEASGTPRPAYTWKRNGIDFNPSGNDARMVQLANVGTIVINRPEAKDEGMYQCFASNDHGRSATILMYLREAKLKDFPMESDITYRPQVGDSLTLQCVAPESVPAAQVFWAIRENSGGISPITYDPRVTMDHESRLRFVNVQPSDFQDGNAYMCMAMNTFLRRNILGRRHLIIPQGVTPVLRPAQFMWSSPSDVVGLLGQSFRVKCIFQGNPTPDVHWSRADNKRISSRAQVVSFGQELLFEDLQLEDAGLYECWATNTITPQRVLRVIDIRVQSAPRWLRKPENQVKAPGETAEFDCEASGIPPPEVVWFINSVPRYDVTDPRIDGRFTFGNNGTLRIVNLTLNDAMVIQCNASNKHGYIWGDAYLDVLVEPASVARLPSEVTGVAGKALELECSTGGSPAPDVTWYRDGRQLSRELMNSNNSLMFANVSMSDPGNYTCKAINKYGSQSSTVYLHVIRRTAIVSGPSDISTPTDGEVFFFCTATADPQEIDKLKLRWQVNGRAWIGDDTPRFAVHQQREGQYVKGRLMLMGVITRDSGTYSCHAQSPRDSQASAPAVLTVLSPPSPPNGVTVATCGRLSATLRWEPVQAVPPVTRYRVEFRALTNSSSWALGAEVDGSFSTATVPLTPFANFTFRVISYNALGDSTQAWNSWNSWGSQPRLLCRQQETAQPPHNPRNVRALGSQPDKLVIEWTPMPEEEHWGPGFEYLLTFRKPGGTASTRSVIPNWRSSVFVVDTPGEVYTEYLITVKARNALGEAVEGAVEVRGHTGEIAPTVTPQGLTVINVTSTTAVLTFPFNLARMNAAGSPVNGKFHGFKVYSWAAERRAETLRVGEVAAQAVLGSWTGNVRVQVAGLAPFTRTLLALAVRNSFYRGPLSSTVSFTTLEAEPGLPGEIRVRKTTRSSLLVEWDPPSSPNGVITGYTLAWQSVNGLHLGFLNYAIDNQNVTSALVSDLDAGATYRLHVSACNAIGCGEAYFTDVTTAEAGSDVTRSYDVDEVCMDGLRVTWSFSPLEVNGSSLYVRYRLAGAARWQRTAGEEVLVQANSSDTAARPWWRLLHPLHPDTPYQVQLVIDRAGTDVNTSYVTTVWTLPDEASACSMGNSTAGTMSPRPSVESTTSTTTQSADTATTTQSADTATTTQSANTTATTQSADTTATTTTSQSADTSTIAGDDVTNTTTRLDATTTITTAPVVVDTTSTSADSSNDTILFPPTPKPTIDPTSTSARRVASLRLSLFVLVFGLILL